MRLTPIRRFTKRGIYDETEEAIYEESGRGGFRSGKTLLCLTEEEHELYLEGEKIETEKNAASAAWAAAVANEPDGPIEEMRCCSVEFSGCIEAAVLSLENMPAAQKEAELGVCPEACKEISYAVKVSSTVWPSPNTVTLEAKKAAKHVAATLLSSPKLDVPHSVKLQLHNISQLLNDCDRIKVFPHATSPLQPRIFGTHPRDVRRRSPACCAVPATEQVDGRTMLLVRGREEQARVRL